MDAAQYGAQQMLAAALARPPQPGKVARFEQNMCRAEATRLDTQTIAERLTGLREQNTRSSAKFDLCRHCLAQLHFMGRYEPDWWLDFFGEAHCDTGLPHEPFPGAYLPTGELDLADMAPRSA
jgi:hypothetical protein